jgi:hypothetical protein
MRENFTPGRVGAWRLYADLLGNTKKKALALAVLKYFLDTG